MKGKTFVCAVVLGIAAYGGADSGRRKGRHAVGSGASKHRDRWDGCGVGIMAPFLLAG